MTGPQRAAEAFGLHQRFSPLGNGHIHDTYRSEDGRFVLQRVNTEVFRDPDAVMENIVRVTAHLRAKLAAAGRDPACEVPALHPAADGSLLWRDGSGCWRVFDFIPGSRSIEPEEASPEIFREAGRALGDWETLLADFDASLLKETIPHFHDTPVRLAALRKAAERDAFGRARSVRRELDFAFAREKEASVITDGLADGSIPLAVTHNDTKLDNVLFDARTGRALALIDLDTVMPGSRLYDYGDALRSGASAASEDERDLSKIRVDRDIYRAFTEGYLSAAGDALSAREKELMPLSVRLMTYECGVRFLTDYLEGDRYFKIHREGHNLDRARAHFRFVEALEEAEAGGRL